MKYLVILTDGAADYPVPDLGGKTPLQYCKKPNIDRLAQQGEVGTVRTVPPGMKPGSDVANLSVMGYDPKVYFTGRSPIEAVSIGVDLQPTDVAFRFNLVTLSSDSVFENKTMIDYSSDEITTAEAALLVEDLGKTLNNEIITLYSGNSYRHLMVWQNGVTNTNLTPPHQISGRKIKEYLPQGNEAPFLLDLMKQSLPILENHSVNRERIARGLKPATSIWFWGQGKKPKLKSFASMYQLQGSVISAVDLAKGLGICAGLKVINVPGATGTINTNFRGKAEAALNAFKQGDDFVYLHLEAPDEAGHQGDVDTKIRSIEKIDTEVVGVILQELPKITGEFRIMLLPDHPTPLTTKDHAADPVPYLIYTHSKPITSGVTSFNEETAKGTGAHLEEGHRLMEKFLSFKGLGRVTSNV